jgi:F0F1-type ATP synthase membrane subunit b/b'
VTARANQKLKVFAGPDVTQAEFMKTCSDVAREARDAEIEKKTAQVERKIKTLEDKLEREERELRQDESDLQNRKLEAGANLLELGAGMFGFGRKKSVTTQFTKHRLSKQAEENVQESVDVIAQYKKDLVALQSERDDVVAQVNNAWGSVVNEIDEVTITPKKTDIYVKLFGVAWMPYYIVQAGAETLELPAFGAE